MKLRQSPATWDLEKASQNLQPVTFLPSAALQMMSPPATLHFLRKTLHSPLPTLRFFPPPAPAATAKSPASPTYSATPSTSSSPTAPPTRKSFSASMHPPPRLSHIRLA